jgi:hypothetical protein
LLTALVIQGYAKDGETTPENCRIFSYGIETGYNSRYVSRGIVYSQGAVIQPNPWISAYGITLGIWGNYNIQEETASGQFNELDYGLSYDQCFGDMSLQYAFVYYVYPNSAAWPDTAEVLVDISYPLKGLTLFANNAFDVMNYPGAYIIEAGVSKEIVLFQELLLSCRVLGGAANAVFNEAYIGISNTALNFIGTDISIKYSPLGGNVYIQPHLQVSYTADNELAQIMQDPNIMTYGILVGMEF